MITDKDFQQIVQYVRQHYGIDLSQKRVLVKGRLETHFLREGFSSCAEFMDKVIKEPQGEEAKNLINVLTTNHTYFMRETVHFDYMQKYAIPYWKKKLQNTKDLRTWSAASSTGEEPYTLAMILLESFGLEGQSWDTKLLATDVSTKVLEHAVKGVYLKEQIEPLPEKWKRRFFKQRNEEEFEAKPELKNQVIFRRFNLMHDLPFKRKFHIVFLRNVMIYFPDKEKYALVERIYDHMEPGGFLFIGTTESLDKEKTRFEYIQPSIYRKKE